MPVSESEDLPPLASFAVLVRKLGYTPEDDEKVRAENDLADASELIRDTASKDWVDDNGVLSDVPRRVAQICIAVAYRAFTNPDALTQRTIGDSSRSYDRAKREGGEAIYLTDAEKKAIEKAAGASGMVQVTMTSPYNNGTLLDPWDAVTAE
jgi:hypothetical protein